MVNHGSGRVRLEFRIPARGLIGFRFVFVTRNERDGNHVPPICGLGGMAWSDCGTHDGRLVADRAGMATAYALANLQQRGILFINAQTPVYEGMIVGENSRTNDLNVNVTKEKQQQICARLLRMKRFGWFLRR